MMDQSKLEAFVVVAEEESFRAAADRLRLAQSTVSTRIKDLETHLGQRLFERSSRQVRLSAAGEAALPAARTALAALATVGEVVDDVAGVRRGRVRLGLVAGADVPGLGATLAAFGTDYPGIELVISSAPTQDLEVAVADGGLDLALVVRVGTSQPGWTELLRDPLVAVGLPARRAPVPVDALAGGPLVVLDAGAGVRAALEAGAWQKGVRLQVVAQVSTPALARDLHARGMGVLVVPGSLAPAPGTGLVDGAGVEMCVQVGLVSHQDVRTPAADLLLERLRTGLGTSPN